MFSFYIILTLCHFFLLYVFFDFCLSVCLCVFRLRLQKLDHKYGRKRKLHLLVICLFTRIFLSLSSYLYCFFLIDFLHIIVLLFLRLFVACLVNIP